MVEVLLLLSVLLHHCHLSTLLLLSNLLRQTPLILKVLVDVFYAAHLLLFLNLLLMKDGGVVVIAAKLAAFLRCLMRRLLLDVDRSWQDLRLLNRAMLFSH